MAGTVGFLVFDLHGNVAGAETAAQTAYAAAIRYDPYGQTADTYTKPSGGIALAWKFQGRLDVSPDGSPLYDAGARFYAPYLGLFSQLDQVTGQPTDPRSMNRFAYAEANPWTFSDPSGNATCFASSDLCDETMAIRHQGTQAGRDAVRRSGSRTKVNHWYNRALHAKAPARIYETNPKGTPETASADEGWGEAASIGRASATETAAQAAAVRCTTINRSGPSCQTAQQQADGAATTAGIGRAVGRLVGSMGDMATCVASMGMGCNPAMLIGLGQVTANPSGAVTKTLLSRFAALQSGDKAAGADAITSTALDVVGLALLPIGGGAADASDAALAANSAAEGADFLQTLGLSGRLRPPTAAGFAKGGRVAGGFSGSPTSQFNALVQELLDQRPGGTGTYGGTCAEMQCLSNVYDEGIDPVGGVMEAVRVRAPGDPRHGTPLPACDVCRWVLDQVGVTHS